MFGAITACALLVSGTYGFSINKPNNIGINLLNSQVPDTQVNADFQGQGWHIHVTMHVFSGRSDPTWFVLEDHPAYDKILHGMKSQPSQNLPSRLGYKGFSLVHVPPGQNVVNGGHFNQTVTSFPDWEMFLLQTSEKLDDELMNHVKQSIMTAKRRRRSLYDYGLGDYDLGSLFGTTADPIDSLTDKDMYELAKLWGLDKKYRNITTTPTPMGPTRFEPTKWNAYFMKKHNNCYNYANNKVTETFAQPGRAGGCTMTSEMNHGSDIAKLAKCDGLVEMSAPDSYTIPSHPSWNLVALVFWPPKTGSDTFDFHWYRLDGNNRWSHKPGKTDATNVDQSNQPITDPRHADRGPYTEFVAFFKTRQDKVIIL